MPSKNVQDRIDLLAVDKEGVCYIIELKRGNHKLQLFQAISYAGMVAQWELEDVLQLLHEEQQDALVDFLDVDTDDINREQRIILVAEAYDFALLTGTEWLCEQYGVGITCCRISLAKGSATNVEYLVCSNVYPAPELAKEALPRGVGNSRSRPPILSELIVLLSRTGLSLGGVLASKNRLRFTRHHQGYQPDTKRCPGTKNTKRCGGI